MKTLLIVTQIDFWWGGAGHRARLASMIRFLEDKIKITVVYAGRFDTQDENILKIAYPNVAVEILDRSSRVVLNQFVTQFKQFITGKIFDAVLVEYLELSVIVPYLEGNPVTILDTHDLVSDRIESFRKNELPYHGTVITADEEFNIFDWFDYVVMIQEHEYKKVLERKGHNHVLLVPHAVTVVRQPMRKSVHQVGFVASEYAPNVDALVWFLQNVWETVSEPFSLTLNVYGNVCIRLPKDLQDRYPSLRLRGYASDLNEIYSSCDIIVNPVRSGAGLKIKNVEALANGLPLITTTHGATGMENGIDRSFLLADTPADFFHAFQRLISDPALRSDMCENAFVYAKKHFSPNQCYAPLMSALKLM